jgi:hypothetical protein|nr:MAG TPA: hypothetical protein [Caudoviricetes sp.]
MNVKELIKELEKFDEDMEVQYDFGRCGNMPITELSVKNESDYSRKKVVVIY